MKGIVAELARVQGPKGAAFRSLGLRPRLKNVSLGAKGDFDYLLTQKSRTTRNTT